MYDLVAHRDGLLAWIEKYLGDERSVSVRVSSESIKGQGRPALNMSNIQP